MKVRRSIATLAVVAGGLAPLAHSAPAGASTGAIGTCSVTGVASANDRQEVVLAVRAVYPGASFVTAGCGIVQHGVVVAYVRSSGTAAAVGATTASIDQAPYTLCSEVSVVFPDGRQVSDGNCP